MFKTKHHSWTYHRLKKYKNKIQLTEIRQQIRISTVRVY